MLTTELYFPCSIPGPKAQDLLNWFCGCGLPYHAVVVVLVQSHLFSVQIFELQWCLPFLNTYFLQQFVLYWIRYQKLKETAELSVQSKEFCCNISHQAFGLKSKLYFIMQVSNFPLLLIFIFLSIHISALLFLDDRIMNWESSRFKKTNDPQAFPLSSFSFLYKEAREVVSKYFVILHLSAKLGVKR